jgi:acetyltransferase-like isoleucine patch superfamily enzyme
MAAARSALPEPREPAGFTPWSRAAWLRFGWTIVSAFALESVVLGLAALPAVSFWAWHFQWEVGPWGLRVLVLAMSFVPAYLIFALALMAASAWATRITGWRPRAGLEVEIAELPWPLLDWVRYAIATHVVRVLAGSFLKNTPLWNWYLRQSGARIGRRVWINSLDVSDPCLLEFDDDVVIGAGAHLSGHTVEHGLLRTARVKLGRGVTVGVNANVEIGVEAGPGCQIGALSEVPKYTKLAAHGVYVGAPVRRLDEKTATPEENPS